MSEDLLTPHNLQLSRPRNDPEQCISRAINCTNLGRVSEFVAASLSSNTQRAYLSDLAHFENWGGSLPASPETLAAYLADHAHTLSIATLSRRLASISKAHKARSLPNPVSSELVRSTLRGIKRQNGVAQRQAKPLLKEDLFQILDALKDTPRDVRDKALLLIGFAGGFRRSELVDLNLEDIEFDRRGIIIHLRRSKTDQFGEGRKVAIPYGRTRHCPVLALENWTKLAGITGGPIFRRVDRHGKIKPQRLSGEAISNILRSRLAQVGIDPINYSGHSLRAGLATSAAQAGVPTWKIRQQTGHASDAMLSRYVRDGEMFVGNAVLALL